MPALTTAQLPKETAHGFLGVNLRQDGLTLADQDVLRAINADFHRQLGTIQPRAGRTLLAGSTTLPTTIRLLARHMARRYQAAGTILYRNFVSILTGLQSNAAVPTTVVPYRPLLDDTTWTFIADQGLTPLMRKDNGLVVTNWGIAAPTAAPTLAAGAATPNLDGDYGAVYTYARYTVGGKLAHESNPSPLPGAIPLASQALNITVVASTDPQVGNIRVYRTLDGGSRYFFDQVVSNVNQTVFSTQVDGDLGTEVEFDNDPPVPASWVTEFQGHLFLVGDAANPDHLWYSKHFRPESFPTEQFLKIGDPSDPLQSSVALTGMLGVFTRLSKYRILGNSVSGFVPLEAMNTRGIVAPQALLASSRGALFVARDGLFLTNFVEQDQEISQALEPLFYGQTVNDYAPLDFAAAHFMTLAEYKRRLYFGYRDTNGTQMLAIYSLDTQHWYHYVHPVYRLFYEEDLDQLTMGDTTGRVWVLEQGTADGTDAITTQVTLPPRAGGDRFSRKGYKWLGVDSVGGWSVEARIDDVSVLTAALSGARHKRYTALPANTAGYQWQSVLTSTAAQSGLYAVEMLHETHMPGEVAVEDGENPGWFLQVLAGSPVNLPLTRRRFSFLVLDADTVATSTTTGIWSVDLYIDQVLAASVDIPGVHKKLFWPLPPGLTGFEHYVRARYAPAPVPLLYALEVLDSGPPDGQVWIRAALDPQAYVTILPAKQPPDTFRRKRFGYVRLDAEAATGIWTLDLYIDQLFRTRLFVRGDRNRDLVRLPPNLHGYTWHIVASYSEAAIPTLFGVEVLTLELKAA